MTPIEAGALFDLLRRRSVHVTPAGRIALSRDADLLSLREVQSIPVVDIPTFWRTLSEHPDQR